MDSLIDSSLFATPDLAERLRLAEVVLDAEEFADFLKRITAERLEEAA